MNVGLPPAWRDLVRALNRDPSMVGDAGVRDPEHPCDTFDPLPDGKKPVGYGDCHGDGHYLCLECSHLSMDSEWWPSIDCPACTEKGWIEVGCKTCNDRGVVNQPGWERSR